MAVALEPVAVAFVPSAKPLLFVAADPAPRLVALVPLAEADVPKASELVLLLVAAVPRLVALVPVAVAPVPTAMPCRGLKSWCLMRWR